MEECYPSFIKRMGFSTSIIFHIAKTVSVWKHYKYVVLGLMFQEFDRFGKQMQIFVVSQYFYFPNINPDTESLG